MALVNKQHKALIEKFKQSMQDKAKISILNYMEQNPGWSPEEIVQVSKMYIQHFGLTGRYVPGNGAKAIEEGWSSSQKVEGADADSAGTQTTPSTT